MPARRRHLVVLENTAYIRGKLGVIVGESPAYPFPDARFRSEDLWPNGADATAVHAGVFESYLEPAS
jgi:nitrile hydratase